MDEAMRHQGPTIEWDIDNNLPMYTKDFIKNLPYLVEEVVVDQNGELIHLNPWGVKFVMKAYPRPAPKEA